MSDLGYVGRTLKIVREGEVIAAVRTKNVRHIRDSIDRTNEEGDGWRHIDEEPDVTSVEFSVEGVATSENYQWLKDAFYNDGFEDITILHSNGTVEYAEDGAYLQSLTHTGEHNGFVAFNAAFTLSGLVSIVEEILLTSRPYALESTDTLTVEGRALNSVYWPVVVEQMSVGAGALDSTLEDRLITYDDWPAESMSVAGAEALDGTLVDLANSYDDWPVEEMDVAAEALDGTLNQVLIRYEAWPAEEMSVSAEALDGSLVGNFEDDFESDTLDQYTSSDGAWSISGGQCFGPTSASQSVLSRDDFTTVDGYCEVDCDQASNGGLVLRYVDDNNYYMATLRDDAATGGNNITLYRRVGGSFTSFDSANLTWTRGDPHVVRFEVEGDALRVYFDGGLVIDATDSNISSAGKIGIRSTGETAGDKTQYLALRWGNDLS